MGNDNIFVAADLPEDDGLELYKVGFSAFEAEVSFDGFFKIPNGLSKFVRGLNGLQRAVDL